MEEKVLESEEEEDKSLVLVDLRSQDIVVIDELREIGNVKERNQSVLQ